MKKIIVKLIATIILLVKLTSSHSATAQDKIQVTFWHAMNAHNQEMITQLVEEFNASQDRIEVIEQNQGDNSALNQKLMSAGVSGNLPTISQIIAANQPQYISNGLLLPINNLLTEESAFSPELLDSIFDGFLQEVTVDGEIYALPFNKSVRVMYVNNTILEEVGVETPQSWQDIAELGQIMLEKGYDIPALGIENSFATEYEGLARSNGAIWISPELDEVEMSSDRATEPLIFLQNMIQDGYVRTAGEDGFMSTPFGNGASALYLGSSAAVAYLQPVADENNYQISAIEIPNFGSEKAGILFGNNIGIFDGASEEQQKAAIEFIAFLLNDENTARWAINSGYLPVTEGGVATDLWQDHLAANPVLKAASDTLEYATPSPAFPGQSEIYADLVTGLENVFVNSADPQEMLQEIENQTLEALGLN